MTLFGTTAGAAPSRSPESARGLTHSSLVDRRAGTPDMLAALKGTVVVPALIAKTVGWIYPERFRIMSVNEEIDRLVQDSDAVFGRHARPQHRAS